MSFLLISDNRMHYDCREAIIISQTIHVSGSIRTSIRTRCESEEESALS